MCPFILSGSCQNFFFFKFSWVWKNKFPWIVLNSYIRNFTAIKIRYYNKFFDISVAINIWPRINKINSIEWEIYKVKLAILYSVDLTQLIYWLVHSGLHLFISFFFSTYLKPALPLMADDSGTVCPASGPFLCTLA